MSPSYLIADALPGHVDGRAHDGGIGGSLGGLGDIGHAERRDSRCPGIDGAGEAAASRRDATCTEFGKNKKWHDEKRCERRFVYAWTGDSATIGLCIRPEHRASRPQLRIVLGKADDVVPSRPPAGA